MKLIDGNSKIGRKLEEWFPHDKEERKQLDENELERLKEKNQRRNLMPSPNVTEKKLEKKVAKWFIASEEDEHPFIIEEKLGTRCHQILVLTYFRAILFEAGWFGRLKDISDKVWRQFVTVHLSEESFFSSLELSFFPYHDSVSYHNPLKGSSDLKKDDFTIWTLKRLDKKEARRIYAFLKDKELYWQKKRHKEHIECQKMLVAKPQGDALPLKKSDAQADSQ